MLGKLKSSSFDATERQVVLMTASFENECHYCVAAHSVIARIQGVPSDVVQALRDGKDLSDRKLEALRTFTRRVVQEGGWVAEENVEEFLHAGFSKRQVLEVILGVGLKTLSNYTNHIVKPPVDRAFRSQSWTRPSAVSSV